MMLVIALGLMTFAACAALAWPLLRGRDAGPTRAEFDRAVYRDQLAEISRDEERGVIGTSEAAAARAEIERRALTALDRDAAATGGASRHGRAFAMALIVVLPTAAGLAYLLAGSPELPGRPFTARPKPPPAPATADPKTPSPQALAALSQMLEARLLESPTETQGWTILTRLYRRQGRADDVAALYAKAVAGKTGPDRAAVALAYGEAVMESENGMITPAARQAFDEALAAEPANPAARYYRGAALAQGGDPKGALALWRELEKSAPADAPWRASLRANIEKLERETGGR